MSMVFVLDIYRLCFRYHVEEQPLWVVVWIV